jgi:MFS transporter, PAT family, beta-lactamase induction signal transducer AmpG
MYTWLAMSGADLGLLVFVISVDNFAYSFAGTALIAYMSALTGAGFAATQYALLSSLYALPGKLVAGVSGFMVEAFGYPAFFVLTAAVGIPVVMLLGWLWRRDEADEPPGSSAPPR